MSDKPRGCDVESVRGRVAEVIDERVRHLIVDDEGLRKYFIKEVKNNTAQFILQIIRAEVEGMKIKITSNPWNYSKKKKTIYHVQTWNAFANELIKRLGGE